MTPRRIALDSFCGTRRDLLALLRALHEGETLCEGMSRLQAIDDVCAKAAEVRS